MDEVFWVWGLIVLAATIGIIFLVNSATTALKACSATPFPVKQKKRRVKRTPPIMAAYGSADDANLRPSSVAASPPILLPLILTNPPCCSCEIVAMKTGCAYKCCKSCCLKRRFCDCPIHLSKTERLNVSHAHHSRTTIRLACRNRSKAFESTSFCSSTSVTIPFRLARRRL